MAEERGHEHEHDHSDEEEVIVLEDEDGVEQEFTLMDAFEVDDKKYAVLLPLAEGGDEDEALILRIETDESGEEVLVHIEDDEEFERVAEAWEELLDEDDEDEEEDEAEDAPEAGDGKK